MKNAVLAVALCIILTAGNLYFDNLKPGVQLNNRDVTAAAAVAAKVQDNPVLAAIRAAAAGDDSSSELAPSRADAVHNQTCCRLGSISGVLTAAAAFQAPGCTVQADNSMQESRKLMLAFRALLAKPWEQALQSVVAANAQPSNSSSCQCRSVELLAARSHNSSQSTAMLLVVNSWPRLHRELSIYSVSLLMMWFYARMHGYGLHIYVHGADLPPYMPVYFIKPAGILHVMNDLGYQHVLYHDWDVLISPHTAAPLSLFYREFPSASLLFQGEYNLAAGTNLWRNTPEGRAFLQAWWDLGAQGCCPTAQHDQSAIKHIVAAYLANITGQPNVYGPRLQKHFKLPSSLPPPLAKNPVHEPYAVLTTEPPPAPVSTYLKLRPILLEKQSAIGLVGLDIHFQR
jgi:hypothetical protein